MRKTISSLLAALSLSAVLTLPAAAQVELAVNTPAGKGTDIYAGGAYQSSNVGNVTNNWIGGVDINLMLGAKISAEVGFAPVSIYNGFNKSNVTDFLVGPRYFFPITFFHRVRPYADVMLGAENLNNTRTDHSPPAANGTHLALAADGGVEYAFARHFAVRGQIGLLRSSFDTNFTSPSTTTASDRVRGAGFLVFRF